MADGSGHGSAGPHTLICAAELVIPEGVLSHTASPEAAMDVWCGKSSVSLNKFTLNMCYLPGSLLLAFQRLKETGTQRINSVCFIFKGSKSCESRKIYH